MSTWHTVRQGECLSLIGQRLGIPWKKIWDDPENQSLREKRGNPEILLPGDRIFLPEKDRRDEFAGAEKKHKFKQPCKQELRICLRDHTHRPMVGVTYCYVIDGEPQGEQDTGEDGIALCVLPRGVRKVDLELAWGVMAVDLACLDPANTTTGFQQRLVNLGFDPGEMGGTITDRTRTATIDFQKVEGIEQTGEIDESTIRMMRELHDGETLPKQEALEPSVIEDDDVREQPSIASSLADEIEEGFEDLEMIELEADDDEDLLDARLIDLFADDELELSQAEWEDVPEDEGPPK